MKQRGIDMKVKYIHITKECMLSGKEIEKLLIKLIISNKRP